jgi:hypothetical protein
VCGAAANGVAEHPRALSSQPNEYGARTIDRADWAARQSLGVRADRARRAASLASRSPTSERTTVPHPVASRAANAAHARFIVESLFSPAAEAHVHRSWLNVEVCRRKFFVARANGLPLEEGGGPSRANE